MIRSPPLGMSSMRLSPPMSSRHLPLAPAPAPALALALALSLALALAAPARAQAPEPAAGPSDQLPIQEPAPEFQPVRPVDEPADPPEAVTPAPMPTPAPAPLPAAAPPPPAEMPAAPPAPPAVSPLAIAAPLPALPAWAMSVVLLLGAFLAGLFGVMTAAQMRRGEMARRRRAVAVTIATELETRLQAFEVVPLPPNAEAGVFFVSTVTSLAGIDAGFRAAQADLHLLPGKLASHISVHYAAVQRVADFVKGQSLAAAIRMMQANRMGGHPCPDAGTMREAHVELGAAFRGLDKLVGALRAAAG